MSKSVFVVVNLFLTIILSPYCCHAFGDNDFQYWNSQSIETKFCKGWKIEVGEEFRFGDNASSFYYNHTDVGVNYSLAEYLELGINYRHIYQKKDEDWDLIHRPHFNGTIKIKKDDFVLKDRNRFEYSMQDDKDSSWRYRNKLSADLPFKLSRFNIQPYIADEIFVDFDKKEPNRNRLYLGLKMDFLKNLGAEIFYLWQSTKGSKWKDYNVLGISLKLAF